MSIVSLRQQRIVVRGILLCEIIAYYNALDLLHLIHLVHLERMLVHNLGQRWLISASKETILRQIEIVKDCLGELLALIEARCGVISANDEYSKV